jgi:hypothetical protein
MTEIERVAQAIQAKCVERGYRGCPAPLVHHVAGAAIEAVNAYRAEEKRKNCKHFNRIGNGYAGSDGSSWSAWSCQSCGASYDSRTPTVSEASGDRK